MARKAAAKKPMAKKVTPKKLVAKKLTAKKPTAKRAAVKKTAIRTAVDIPAYTTDIAGRRKTTRAEPQITGRFSRLLSQAQKIVDNSTAAEAKNFDVSKWLNEWIELPQPALGGRKPVEMIDTDDGLGKVERILGAIASGSYQ